MSHLWSQRDAYTPIKIVAPGLVKAYAPVPDDAIARWEGSSFGPDQRVRVKVGHAPTDTTFSYHALGPTARISADKQTFVSVQYYTAVASGDRAIYLTTKVAGAYVTNFGIFRVVIADGDWIEVLAAGPTFVVRVNDVVITEDSGKHFAVNDEIASGQPGFQVVPFDNGTGPSQVDDVSITDFMAGPA
jgi:hypothetical protein